MSSRKRCLTDDISNVKVGLVNTDIATRIIEKLAVRSVNIQMSFPLMISFRQVSEWR